jgi:hypothetical protein
VAKMGKSKQSALRFALYVKALGGEPVPFNQRDFGTYAIALQQQYEELRHSLDRKVVVEARNAARALIRKQTLAVAAQAIIPISQSASRDEEALDAAFPTAGQINVTSNAILHEETRSCMPSRSDVSSSRAVWNCQRKIRHPDYLSAIKHARCLGDEELNIYPCSACSGLHVGHDPHSETVKQRRYARRQLQSIAKRLELLDTEKHRLRLQQKTLAEKWPVLAGHI